MALRIGKMAVWFFLVFLFLTTGFLVSDREAQASGGINWKCTVNNPASMSALVRLLRYCI